MDGGTHDSEEIEQAKQLAWYKMVEGLRDAFNRLKKSIVPCSTEGGELKSSRTKVCGCLDTTLHSEGRLSVEPESTTPRGKPPNGRAVYQH